MGIKKAGHKASSGTSKGHKASGGHGGGKVSKGSKARRVAGAIIGDIPVAGTVLRAGQALFGGGGAKGGHAGGHGRKRARIGFKRSDLKSFRRVLKTAKVVNKILGKAGVGRHAKRMSHGSQGVITRDEALSALRR